MSPGKTEVTHEAISLPGLKVRMTWIMTWTVVPRRNHGSQQTAWRQKKNVMAPISDLKLNINVSIEDRIEDTTLLRWFIKYGIHHRDMVEDATSRGEAALNANKEHDEFYVAVYKKDSLPSCRRMAWIPKVSKSVMDLVKSGYRKAWCRGYLKP